MMTGEHSEVTGVLGGEVRQDGFRLTPQDQDFWAYNTNTTTLWVLLAFHSNSTLNIFDKLCSKYTVLY
jgi:hypothetical protein